MKRNSLYAVVCMAAAAFSFFIACAPTKKYLVNQGKTVAEKETSYIRVLVMKNSKPVTLSSEGGIRITNLDSQAIEHESSLKKSVFAPDMVKKPLRIDSLSGMLMVDGVPYRGLFELHNEVGTLQVINIVKMEDYLCSVVPAEISPSWPAESIKAQAVAARTYAYYHILRKTNEMYDLDATTNFQVYKGASAETEKTSDGVTATAGEIVAYQNKPILAFFHSTCGGSTTDSYLVWQGEKIPYLSAKKCNYCSDSPYYSWEEDISISALKNYFSEKYSNVGRITGISFSKFHGRVTEAVVRHDAGMIKMSGNDFRIALPEKLLKSMNFDAKKNGKMIHFSGHGWGHGVGMCQYGARGMALQKKSYHEILAYYYKDTSFVKINDGR